MDTQVQEQAPVQEVAVKIDALVEALAKLKEQLSALSAAQPQVGVADVKAALIELLKSKNPEIVEAVKEVVDEAVNNIDFDDKVDSAVSDYDWDSVVEEKVDDAVSNIDLDDKVRDVLSNITLRVQL